MKTQKERQLMIASVLLDMGMDDGLIEVVTNLKEKEFQHLKKVNRKVLLLRTTRFGINDVVATLYLKKVPNPSKIYLEQ